MKRGKIPYEPLVSIIVPVYNAAPYLEECLDSIQGQTHRNIQVILVNDGSTDNSEFICLQFVGKDGRFEYTKQKNSGVSSARNTGLALRKGEYCSFVDADDVVSSDYIMYLTGILVEQGADIVTVPAIPFRDTSEIAGWSSSVSLHNERLDASDALVRMYYGTLDGGENGMQLFSASLLDSGIRFDEAMSIGEDFDFLARLVLASNFVVVDSRRVYFYRVNPTSAMNRPIGQGHFKAINNVSKAGYEAIASKKSIAGLEDAINARMLSDSVYYATKAYEARGHFKKDYGSCLDTITERRWRVLKDRKAKRTTRIKALVACAVGAKLSIMLLRRLMK